MTIQMREDAGVRIETCTDAKFGLAYVVGYSVVGGCRLLWREAQVSFELFIWRDEQWVSTQRRFKTRESAESAGQGLSVEGPAQISMTPEYDVRPSKEKPNE